MLAGRGRARLRGRAVLASPSRSRWPAGAWASSLGRPDVVAALAKLKTLPRLRDVPADPDRLDRGDARGFRLPGRGERDLPRPPRRALLRPRPRRLAHRPAERNDVRWAPIPEEHARARLAGVRAASSPARPTSRSARASASARAATATSASRSSRTSSGSTRPRARSASSFRGSNAVTRRRAPSEAEPTWRAYFAKTPCL